jgi:molybdate transport system ATP-binding protein
MLAVSLRQAGPIPLNVAFTCETARVLALFGPSGSGKSTVLRSIAGLYTPQQARVAIGSETWLDTGRGLDVPAHRRAVGMVFQEYALFPHLSALDNVATALRHRPRGERRERAAAFLDLVQLSERKDRRPASLSGGERQRVAVARALAREPRVLLLDEPFAAVDRALRRSLQTEIDVIRRVTDIPIVLVTHDFDDVVRLATHLALIRHGEVAGQGTIESMTSQPDLPWLAESVGLGTVADAVVVRIDGSRGLAEIEIGGASLYTPAGGLSAGTHVRVRIPAREVILATEVPAGLSVHNVVAGPVTRLASGPHADAVVVQLAIGRIQLLAEVTRDAVTRLRIAEGVSLHALIKSVSLDVLVTKDGTAKVS